MKSLKYEAIENYLSKIDFGNNNWNVNIMVEDMRSFLGEAPGIDVKYKKDILINEGGTSVKEIVVLDKFYIVFTDVDDKIKKLEFIV